MGKRDISKQGISRRDLLRAGLYGMGVGAVGAFPVPPLFARTAASVAAQAANDNKILVVFELSGGNDGLNTLVPYGDDAYYRHRPDIGLKADTLRKIDDHFGFNRGTTGFERLYKDGKMAVVHGCGYENPSFSHIQLDGLLAHRRPQQRRRVWMGRTPSRRDGARRGTELPHEHRLQAVAGSPGAGNTHPSSSTTRTSSLARAFTRNGKCSSTCRTARVI